MKNLITVLISLFALCVIFTSCNKTEKENPIPTTTQLVIEDFSRRISIVVSGTWDIHTVVVTRNADTVSQYQYIDNGSIPYFSAEATKGDNFTVYVPKRFSSVSGLITIGIVNSESKIVDIEEAETRLEYIVK